MRKIGNFNRISSCTWFFGAFTICPTPRSDGGAILATGGVDGLAKVLNVNTGKNIAAFDCRGSKEREQAEDRLVGFCAISVYVGCEATVCLLSLITMVGPWPLLSGQTARCYSL